MTVSPPFPDLLVGSGWGVRQRVAHVLQEARHRFLGPAYAHLLMRRRRDDVRAVTVRPALATASTVVVLVLKDEAPRVPYFLQHYRGLGVEHFIFIDNGSTDGLQELLAEEQDVTVFLAPGDYKEARYGRDWVNVVLHEHCVGKWVSWVDADELLVFSTRPDVTVQELVTTLRSAGRSSLNVLMLDMYSEEAASANLVAVGQDPLSVCGYFDPSGYVAVKDRASHQRFWIKGGVRGRLFFPDALSGPALNKTVMVLWRPSVVFLRGAHELWPNRLNGTGRPSGILLHFKFTAIAATKMLDAGLRDQHTEEYAAYDSLDEVTFVDPGSSRRYVGPESAVSAGLFRPLL